METRPFATEFSASSLRRVCLIPGAIHPFWHLLAPVESTDPWILWWILGAGLFGVGVGAVLRPEANRWLTCGYHFFHGLIATHLLVLASLNGMEPFYAAGSALAVTAAAGVIRNPSTLLRFAFGTAALSAVLFAYQPDRLKLACWAPPLLILLVARHRLVQQARAVDSVYEARKELEERVAERTRELSEANRRLGQEIDEKELLGEQLRVAQKMEAVGRLAEGISHDFGNLLTVIGTYANIVYDELPEDVALREDVEQIRHAAQQAATLTQQLLAFSRPRALSRTVLDPNVAIRDAAPILKSFLGEDIELDLQLGADCGCIVLNPVQFEQVLVNLALNARDAMPRGGRFRIETRPLERSELPREAAAALQDDAYVQIAISDTGIGMAPAVRSRAFDPFFSSKKSGTGLGLSIVYGIVQQGNGHVRLLSEPGKGARFEIHWPRSERGAELPVPEPELAETGINKRILIVEDQPEVRRSAVRVLTSYGYTVLEAQGADEALEIAESLPEAPDLVVLDVIMPRMSGLALAEQLQQRIPGVLVLFISGQLGHPALRDAGLPSSAPLLAKPFAPRELVTAVEAALRGPTKSPPAPH